MLDDLTGRIIKSYELKELIGVGGFGAVYRAHQQFIGREVAIKIILPQYANRPDFIRRFETEAQLVARLEHPHIVPLYDYWREPDGAYLVMRWLRGGNVQESVERDGPWEPERVRTMLTQIAEALMVAHRQGIVHRDLKPENLMLDENGNAYLSDFGIAKDLGGQESRITQGNAIVGSPAYLAPEQIQGKDVTPQSDIFALGIVLYEILTGQRPFDVENPATLMYKHLTEPLPDITLSNPNLSPAIDAVIQRATAKDPALRFPDVIELARAFRHAVRVKGKQTDDEAEGSATAIISSSSIVIPQPENPYKGLRAFQQADSQDFFGRDSLIDRIIERLGETTEDSRFLAVVGPSGSGKSSVVKAGVLPKLRQGIIDGSNDWFVVEMVPGIDPMEELEAALLRIAVNPPESLLSQLNEDDRGLLRAAKRVLPADDAELVIVIDQFEEVFTLVDDTIQREHFLNSLVTAATDRRSQLRIIITLRADFYDRPLNYNRFGTLMRERTEIVLPLSVEELERAVSGPAKRAGIEVEPALLSTIVSDVSDQPGALPLLQYALTELFERRQDNVLTIDAYHEIGGTMGALARRAEELYENLGEEGQEATRQMLLRLVALGEGAEDTRRRALQSELMSIGVPNETMSMVIDAFGRYRLLTFDHDPSTRSATIEVAHEALIREWQRLRNWLDASRDDLRAQRRLSVAATEWKASGKDSSFLARGSRLEQIEAWSKLTSLALTFDESEYLEASIQQREKLLALERERQAREQALEKRSRDRLRALVIVMSIAAIISTILAVVAVNQRSEAQQARAEAEDNAIAAQDARQAAEESADEATSLALAANARSALVQNNLSLGLALAIAADAAHQPASVEVLRVLAETAYGPGVVHEYDDHTGSVMGVAISRDGSLSASGSMDGTVRIWNTSTEEVLHVIELSEGEAGIALAFSPTTNHLAALHGDNDIHIYDLSSGEIVQTLSGHTGVVTSLAYDDSGERLVSGGIDRSVILWDPQSGEILRQFEQHPGVIIDVDISSDGRMVASATGDETSANTTADPTDKKVRVFDTDSGELLHTLDPQSGYIRQVVFSPDDTLIAAGSWGSASGGVIDIWNIESEELVQRIFAHFDLIYGVAFVNDNNTIISSSADQSMRMFDIPTALEIGSFEVFENRPISFDLPESSEFVLVGTGHYGQDLVDTRREQATAPRSLLIDLRNRAEIRSLNDHRDWVWGVDVNAAGTLAVTGSGPLRPPAENMDVALRVWDLEQGSVVHTLEGHFSTVEAVRFSPDGRTIASGGWDGQIILWDVESGDKLGHLEDPELELAPVDIIVDGETQPAPMVARAMSGNVLNLRFTADGTRLVGSSSEGYVAVWNIESGELLRKFAEHEGAIAGIDLNPDESLIVTGSWDNSIRLWDFETGKLLRELSGHANRVNDVTFSPDGSQILSASWDNSIRLWDVATGDEIRQLLGHNAQVQTVAFNDAGSLALSGSADASVRLWDVATGREIFQLTNHTNWISEVHFMPDERFAISSAQDNTIRMWLVPGSTETIIDWARENRFIREFTCDERDLYRIEPTCAAEGDA